MSEPECQRDPFEVLVESFLARYRAGERPSLGDYVRRHPELAQQICELFPALIEMEQLAPAAPGSVARAALPTLVLPVAGPACDGPAVRRDSDQVPAPSAVPPRYRLVGEIARGGMGVVLYGHDQDLGRDLAFKVLRDEHAGRPESLRRFVEEAQIGGQLQHPGIVPVYDLGRFGDQRPYFTMKLVRGRTLAALLGERTGLDQDRPRFLGIFQQVAQTLAYAHARGVIHRDLKPANVMVGAFGEVQVMDWGLAKVLKQGEAGASEAESDDTSVNLIRTVRSEAPEAESQPGEVLGTLAYMPPEQANGAVDRLDRRADVFGLGALLCEILTGYPPYTGPSREEVCRKAAHGDQAGMQGRLERCGAEAELVALARGCLAPEASDRPADARAVADGITGYLDGVQERLRRAELERAEAQARATAEGEARAAAQARARAERRARRLTAGLAAAALALVAVGAAGGLLVQRQAAERREAKLRDDLENAELAGAEWGKGQFDRAAKLRGYEKALSEYGINVWEGDVSALAEQLRQLPVSVREPVILALEDWALRTEDAGQRKRLQQAARDADADEWRRKWRDARDQNVEQLRRLAEEARGTGGPALGLRLLARALLERKAVGEAIDLLRHGEKAHPTDFWIHFQLGFLLETEGRTPTHLVEAIGCYKAALACRPQTSAVWNGLGNAWRENNDLQEAIDAYRRAVECDPQSVPAHYNLGLALQESKDLPGALDEYRRAIELDPDQAPAQCAQLLQNLGIAFKESKDLRRAAAAYRCALKIDPRSARSHMYLGNVLNDGNDLQGALDAYRRAVELDPDYADAHYNLGLALQNSKNLPGALDEYRRAIELNPDLAQAHHNRGVVLRLQGRFAAAVKSFQRAHELGSRQRSWRYHSAYDAARSAALVAAGQADDAGQLPDKVVLMLRRQALQWLTADLAPYAQQAEGDDDAAKQEVQRQLRRWQQDADLASVRDAEALSKLPEDERRQWQQLWAAVDAVLERANR